MYKFIPILSLFLLFACKSNFEQTLKSRDIEKKEAAAFEYYEKEDYYKASEIFKVLIQDVKQGGEIEKMFFYYAMCDYKMEDYGLAAYEFERLIQKFPRGQYTEESQFLIGMANYYKAPPSFLDQEYTRRAIESFQLFLDKYPNSERKEDVNKRVDELVLKMETKMYNQAKLYYNIGEFKSSAVALDNMLADFPDSDHGEEVTFLIADSYFQLAKKSIESKQIERFQDAIKASNLFLNRYPKGEYAESAKKVLEDSKNEIKRLKRELPEFYHKTGDYDKSIALYETLLRRSRKMEESQLYAKNMFIVYHDKCLKAPTQNKIENYEALMKFYKELSEPNRTHVNTVIAKTVASAKSGYAYYKANAAFQLYKEGKYYYSMRQYKLLVNDTSVKAEGKDWYFLLLSNYKYASNLEAQKRLMQLDTISAYYQKSIQFYANRTSSYQKKAESLKQKIDEDLKVFPVALVKEPYKAGKYKDARDRAEKLLKQTLVQKDEEEVVYLLIATAVKFAKSGKRFERFGRYTAAKKLLSKYEGRLKSDAYKADVQKLRDKINKGLIKYQIKEE